uniref:Uncharacterized protein n=1 Tax=Tanacetum cinerariifolium TaxID=118510 RepID=A0A699KGB0_TANCI|nr:hypothetical protein [Tanacetum cinerariifolium]
MGMTKMQKKGSSTRVKGCKKLRGYGHLEEIEVKRADRQLYKFNEGDFVDLYLNDIEDMLLLAVQHKLFHLNDSDIVDYILALRVFTRRPIYNLLKGTYTSNIELEYNMEECFKALSDKLDWNKPKGDRRPFDLTKPLPMNGRPGHLTIDAEYFFNNDLEFLKSSDPEKNYTTSITKIKASRYKIARIKDMVPTLWSPIKYGYDKDAEKGIKH